MVVKLEPGNVYVLKFHTNITRHTVEMVHEKEKEFGVRFLILDKDMDLLMDLSAETTATAPTLANISCHSA